MSDEQFAGPMKVDTVENSKSGKSWRVSLGGKWYGAYKDSGILDALQKNIYVITGTLEKGGPWIMKWKVADQTTAIATPTTRTPVASAPNVAPWWMPSVSNVWAHAIQAGALKTPAELNAWGKAAKECAVALAALDEEDVPY
jgi:hypothetical protein